MPASKALYYPICIALIFLVAVGLRVTKAHPDRQINPGDETTYHYAALDILKYGTLTREIEGEMFAGRVPVQPSSWMSPGYPLYIAGIYAAAGESTKAVFASQIVLSILSFWLIYRLLVTLELERPAIVVAIGLAAVYPGFLYNIDRMLTEPLFVALLLAYAYVFIVGAKLGNVYLIGAAGVLLAFATHVRAQAFPFGLLSVFILAVYETRGRRKIAVNVAVFLAAFLVVMLPWWIRNMVTFHHFILFSEGGEGARAWGSVPYFIDMSSCTGSLQETVAGNMSPNPAVYYKWRVFGFLQYMWGDVWDENLVHPGEFLRQLLILQPLVLVPSLLAIPFLIRRMSAATVFIASFPVAFSLMHLRFHGLPRYVYPSVPFLFVVTGIILSAIVRRLKHAAPLAVPAKLDRWQVFADSGARWCFIIASGCLSALTLYSVYVFAYRENLEMSAYRLSRYMNVNIADVPRAKLIESRRYDGSRFAIDNTTKVGDVFVNNVAGPAILRLDDQIAAPAGSKVVSVVTLNAQGGYLFDYAIVYWRGRNTPAISEDKVYRFPTNRLLTSRTVYIDDDVTHLMIVPFAFHGGRFTVSSVEIRKYRLP